MRNSIRSAMRDAFNRQPTKDYMFVISGDRNVSDIINDMCSLGAKVIETLEQDVYCVFHLPEGAIETIIGIESYDAL